MDERWLNVGIERETTMFGIFKKKAPAPLELSDAELDLVHGGSGGYNNGEGEDSNGGYGGSEREVGSAIAVVLRDDARGISLR
jgi:hypothetical protein